MGNFPIESIVMIRGRSCPIRLRSNCKVLKTKLIKVKFIKFNSHSFYLRISGVELLPVQLRLYKTTGNNRRTVQQVKAHKQPPCNLWHSYNTLSHNVRHSLYNDSDNQAVESRDKTLLCHFFERMLIEILVIKSSEQHSRHPTQR